MLSNFKNHFPHYFSTHPNREITEVYWFTIISNLALSMVFIFEPIYLYTQGFSLVRIMTFFLIVYLCYIVLVGFGAKFASRFGYKHAIFFSNIFIAIYWFGLFFITVHPAFFYIVPIFFALQKSWFWPAFDADLSVNAGQGQRGREISVMTALVQVAFIGGPLLGGVISERFGFLYLFVAASLLIMLSSIPLFASPDIYAKHEFTFAKLWRVLRKYPKNFFGYWGFAEDLMLMSLWPIYMYLVVWNFENLGLISTIATIVGTVIMLYVGTLIDRQGGRHTIIFESSVVYGATWILRFLAQGVALVLGFDIMTKAAKNIINVPMNSLTYENAAVDDDNGLAYSVFFEFSLSVGKIVTALAAIAILSWTNNIFLVFAFVGVLTMFYGLLRKNP